MAGTKSKRSSKPKKARASVPVASKSGADDAAAARDPLNFVPSCNMDDDDSDDDDFLKAPTFSKPSKDDNAANRKGDKQGTEAKNHDIARESSATTTITESATTPTGNSSSNTMRQLDPAWIEQQAQHTVDTLTLDVVNGVVNVEHIGWCSEKKRNNVQFFPAIQVPKSDAEASILLEEHQKKSRTSNSVFIRYIGVHSYLASTYDSIPLSRWIPLGSQQQQTTKKSRRKSAKTTVKGNDDERRLKAFLQMIKGSQKEFKESPLSLKIEELAIRKMWAKVQEQSDEAKRRKLQDEEERARIAVVSQDDAITLASPSDSKSPYTDKRAPAKNLDEEEEDDDDDDDSTGLQSPERQREALSLRCGDEIEFYAPEGVAGDPDMLRRATIKGIRPGHEYPLVLSMLSCLPSTHHIRKLPDGKLRAIRHYRLQSEGEHNTAVGLDSMISKFKEARAGVQKAADDFWGKGFCEGDKSGEVDKGVPAVKHDDECDESHKPFQGKRRNGKKEIKTPSLSTKKDSSNREAFTPKKRIEAPQPKTAPLARKKLKVCNHDVIATMANGDVWEEFGYCSSAMGANLNDAGDQVLCNICNEWKKPRKGNKAVFWCKVCRKHVVCVSCNNKQRSPGIGRGRIRTRRSTLGCNESSQKTLFP